MERLADDNSKLWTSDDAEIQRTRSLRAVLYSLEMLKDALSALNHPEPKIHVTRDHIERVIDRLEVESRKLTA